MTAWTDRKFVLVAYEDDYCRALHNVVKALLRERGGNVSLSDPQTAQGTGNFARYVGPWLGQRLRETREQPAGVVLVADADRPGNLVTNHPGPPREGPAAEDDAWIKGLEDAWRASLIQRASLDANRASCLRVLCVRWNKESVLVAALSALRAWAPSAGSLDAVLKSCPPEPDAVADVEYTATFRRPARCMDTVTRGVAERPYKKGRDDVDIMDMIHQSPAALDEVQRRCPDLVRLVEKITEVASTSPRPLA